MTKIAETTKLTASTDIATLSKDSEVGKVLQLRWKRIEKAGAKALVEFDKPLGDLLLQGSYSFRSWPKANPVEDVEPSECRQTFAVAVVAKPKDCHGIGTSKFPILMGRLSVSLLPLANGQ